MSGAEALRVDGFAPEPTCVRDFSYPLSRHLYLGTVKGFENVTGDELKLAQCFAQRSIIDPKVVVSGFVTRNTSAADGTSCRDFNEQTNCGAASNEDACANNIAPIPQ